MGQVNRKVAWTVVLLLLGFLSAFAAYLVLADSAAWRFILRVWLDKAFLKETVQGWGYMGPVVFVVVQALQVIVSPIPGEATGLAGGFLFGTALGFIYSTIGLTLGTLAGVAPARPGGGGARPPPLGRGRP